MCIGTFGCGNGNGKEGGTDCVRTARATESTQIEDDHPIFATKVKRQQW